MVTQILKNTISSIAGRISNLDRRIARKCERYILAYHRILPREKTAGEYIQDTMWTSTESFESQIEWMKSTGEIVDVEEILDLTRKSNRPLFALTFDDGWKDNYDCAFPILKKHGLKATIFLVTSAVNTGRLFWPEELLNKTQRALAQDRREAIEGFISAVLPKSRMPRSLKDTYDLAECYLEYLKELPATAREQCIHDYYAEIGVDSEPILNSILSWDEVLEMDHYGIRFGSHSHTHEILKYLEERTALDELCTSKKVLEGRLNRPVTMFCYPNARYKQTDGRLLEKAGYRFGFRLHNLPVTGRDMPYFVSRILVNEKAWENQSSFKFRLLGVPRY